MAEKPTNPDGSRAFEAEGPAFESRRPRQSPQENDRRDSARESKEVQESAAKVAEELPGDRFLDPCADEPYDGDLEETDPGFQIPWMLIGIVVVLLWSLVIWIMRTR